MSEASGDTPNSGAPTDLAPNVATTATTATTATPEPIVSDGKVADKAPEPSTPPDWATVRDKYAKGDDKVLKRLSRYSSQEAALDALIAAQNRISSGELKAPLPATPTPEELAAWREANGVPAEPTGYDTSLPEGAAFTDDDKPMVDGYLAMAHKLNMPAAVVKESLAYMFQAQEQKEQERQIKDVQILESAQEELHQEWGSEFKLNKNLLAGFIDTAPAGTREQLQHARLADGTPMLSDTKTIRWLTGIARTLNPTATVVPGNNADAAAAIETEIASIHKLMGDSKSEYWKGPGAERMQARYRELVDVREKVSSRA